jgi:hypothetical protein
MSDDRPLGWLNSTVNDTFWAFNRELIKRLGNGELSAVKYNHQLA